MSNDTTRRKEERRSATRLLEVEAGPAAPPPVDEDAAAFLQEAAEAAAAAALEAEALAAELDDAGGALAGEAAAASDESAPATVGEVASPVDSGACAGSIEEAVDASAGSSAAQEGRTPGVADGTSEAFVDDVAAAAAVAAETDAALDAAADLLSAGADAVATASDPGPEAGSSDGEAGGQQAFVEEAEAEAFDPDRARAEAGAALDALEEAAEAHASFPDPDAVEASVAASFAAEAGMEEMARALSEEAPTPEEQALAQAAEERDPDEEEAPAEIAEYDEEAQSSFEKLAAKARRLTEEQARNVLHSILFVADRPLTVEQLRAATGLEPARIRKALEKLAGDLREGISGVVLSEVAGGWQLRTAPESAEYVRRFLQVKPRRLTRAALETLAIIAYRQPVTRPEIEEIRGVDCGAVIKALLDWKLIKILGKKDEVGRPLLYGTSREFLEFFALKDLASLPTLREFHELSEESVQIVEEELGPEAAAGIAGTVAELVDPSYLEAEKERIAKSEQALADLEQALAEAEQKASEVERTISQPAGAGAVSEEDLG